MARKPPEFVSTDDLRTMLRVRYAPPAWALFEEVGNGTGFGVNRHADAVAMGIWPSRGLEILGFEIKASRSDWLRELKNPKKADEIASYCDRWIVVAGSADIVKDGELPTTWGLLVVQGGKLVTKVEAPKLTTVPLDRSFVAAVLRRAHESQEKIREKAHHAGYVKGVENGPDDHKAKLHRVETERDELKKTIADFEKKSGLSLTRWNGGELGEVVRFIQQERHRRFLSSLEELADPTSRLKAARNRVAQILQSLDEDIEGAQRIRTAIDRKEPAA